MRDRNLTPDPNVKEKLLKRMQVGNKTFKVHLDGYNIRDALAGQSPSPRHDFFYFNDDGSLVALRYDNWKIVFAEQRQHGMNVWQEPFVALRLPKLFNLRSDPFETADHEGMDYNRWRVEHLFVMVPAEQYVGTFLATFREFPPSQKPGSFGIDSALAALQRGGETGRSFRRKGPRSGRRSSFVSAVPSAGTPADGPAPAGTGAASARMSSWAGARLRGVSSRCARGAGS
jgi:hypothetical protein